VVVDHMGHRRGPSGSGQSRGHFCKHTGLSLCRRLASKGHQNQLVVVAGPGKQRNELIINTKVLSLPIQPSSGYWVSFNLISIISEMCVCM
jgi:hypothetical protein